MAALHFEEPFNFDYVCKYAVKRFARIAPLYLLVVLFSWAYCNFTDEQFVYPIRSTNIIRHLLFSGSASVFWSIPPEVQFYGFFVFLWLAVAALRQKKLLPAFLVSTCVAGMYVLSPMMPGTTLPTKISFFLFGSVAGVVSKQIRNKSVIVKHLSFFQMLSLSSVVFASIFILKSPGNDEEMVYHSVLYALLCAVMITSFSLPARFGDMVFGNMPMQILGKLSFSIYLLHEPCLYWAEKTQPAWGLSSSAALITGLLGTAVASTIAYYSYERPAQSQIKALYERVKTTRFTQADAA